MNISPEVIVHLSFGTSLAIIIPTSLSGSFAHSRVGNVLWRVVFQLAIPGLCRILAWFNPCRLFKRPFIIKLFALLLIVLSVQMLFQKKEVEESGEFLSPPFFPSLFVGFLVGVFSGFFGLGGGVIAIPLMTWIPRDIPFIGLF